MLGRRRLVDQLIGRGIVETEALLDHGMELVTLARRHLAVDCGGVNQQRRCREPVIVVRKLARMLPAVNKIGDEALEQFNMIDPSAATAYVRRSYRVMFKRFRSSLIGSRGRTYRKPACQKPANRPFLGGSITYGSPEATVHRRPELKWRSSAAARPACCCPIFSTATASTVSCWSARPASYVLERIRAGVWRPARWRCCARSGWARAWIARASPMTVGDRLGRPAAFPHRHQKIHRQADDGYGQTAITEDL